MPAAAAATTAAALAAEAAAAPPPQTTPTTSTPIQVEHTPALATIDCNDEHSNKASVCELVHTKLLTPEPLTNNARTRSRPPPWPNQQQRKSIAYEATCSRPPPWLNQHIWYHTRSLLTPSLVSVLPLGLMSAIVTAKPQVTSFHISFILHPLPWPPPTLTANSGLITIAIT